MTDLQPAPPSASGLAGAIDLFFGDANPAEARVYARSADEKPITGQLTGPECAFAKTLPAHMPFAPLGGNHAISEAIVPDPCFWTPELPFLYRAHIESNGDRTERIIGIRRLGVRGRQLHFDGKRFVLRAVRTHHFEIASAFARETWTALIVEYPSDELCQYASRHGVLLIADLTQLLSPPGRGQGEGRGQIFNELRRLTQWPAVGIALLRGDANLPADIRSLVPNLLLAQSVSGDQPNLASWANLAFVEAADASNFAQTTVPIIAVRRLSAPASVEESRAACDALQRELAPHSDFAGYAV